jgi:hypothetical protein
VEAQYPGASSKLPESDYTHLLAEEVRRLAEAENNDQQGDRQRPSLSQGSLEVKKE